LPVIGALSGVTPFEFRQDLWHQKTKSLFAIIWYCLYDLHLVVLIEHQLVTDGQIWTHRGWQHVLC